jgi:hypothetical protein
MVLVFRRMSVYVRWTGHCIDVEARTKLLDKVTELAFLSLNYFEEFSGFQRFHRTLDGRILISPDLLQGTSLQLPAEAHPPGGFELRTAGPLGPPKPASPSQFLTASQVHLEGLEFPLYDGRRLYPGADRISFVFAFFDEYPALDGSLVYVEDEEQCRLYSNDEIRMAQAFLDSPNIHLRYYYEEWIDNFLGWVKHFFIADLNYWRYERNPGYQRFQELPHDDATRDAFWELIKAGFCAEVEGKAAEAKTVRDFWSAVKPPGESR